MYKRNLVVPWYSHVESTVDLTRNGCGGRHEAEGFDRIRQWLNDNTDDSRRLATAITYQDVSDHTPIIFI